MKTSIIISDDITQVVFEPESEREKKALSLFDENSNIDIAIKQWSIYDWLNTPYSPKVDLCRWWYLRVYWWDDSRMFVITKKDKEITN